MKNIISSHINDNKRIYFLFLFVFIVSVIIGALLFNFSKAETKSVTIEQLSSSLKQFISEKESFSASSYFITNLIKELKYIIIMWFFALSQFGWAVCAGLLIYKGISVGFSYMALNMLFSDQGFFVCLIMIIIGVFIKLIALLFACCCVFRFSYLNKSTGKFEINIFLVFSVYMFISVIIILIAVSFESFVVPGFIFTSIPQLLNDENISYIINIGRMI